MAEYFYGLRALNNEIISILDVQLKKLVWRVVAFALSVNGNLKHVL